MLPRSYVSSYLSARRGKKPMGSEPGQDAGSGYMELKFWRPKEKKVTLTKAPGPEIGS